MFSGAGFWEIQDFGQKGGLLDPEVAISRGESPPQAENFAVFRVLKCRFLRGNRSESGPKMVQIWSNLPDPGNPPLCFTGFWSEGGGFLDGDVLMYNLISGSDPPELTPSVQPSAPRPHAGGGGT